MDQGGDLTQLGHAVEQRLDLVLPAIDDETDVGITLTGNVGAADDDLRRVVPTHGIQRDGMTAGLAFHPCPFDIVRPPYRPNQTN